MPFKSKAQMGAAFGGYLGQEMKSKAKTWAKETPNIKSLPKKVAVKDNEKDNGKKETKKHEKSETKKVEKLENKKFKRLK